MCVVYLEVELCVLFILKCNVVYCLNFDPLIRSVLYDLERNTWRERNENHILWEQN